MAAGMKSAFAIGALETKRSLMIVAQPVELDDCGAIAWLDEVATLNKRIGLHTEFANQIGW